MKLETAHLSENFVNDWYFNQKYTGIVKMLVTKEFFILLLVYNFL